MYPCYFPQLPTISQRRLEHEFAKYAFCDLLIGGSLVFTIFPHHSKDANVDFSLLIPFHG